MFKPEKFFDLSKFEFRDIFDDVNFVWEVLPNIGKYIDSLFQKKILIGNYKGKKNVFLGEGSIVMDGALIEGPAIIGKNCVIGHASYLRKRCLLADSVRIGHGVEIKNSILLNEAIAAHLNYVGDSIVGNKVNVSGGAMLANYRFDGKPIRVRMDENYIDTYLQKFGAIIGDYSKIGANSILNPGTILGKKTIVYPLVSVTGVHKDAEIIK